MKAGVAIINAYQKLGLSLTSGGATSKSTIQVGGRSTLIEASASTVQTFDPRTQFSIFRGNPNGAWSYGRMNAGFGGFTLLSLTYNTPPFQGWNVLNGASPWVIVFLNTSNLVDSGIPPHGLAIHPMPDASPGVLRWTAPRGYSQTTISGRFLPGDVSLTNVSIRRGSKVLFSANDSGAFNLNLANIASGDTIDFCAYGTTTQSSTPIECLITGFL